MIEKTENVPVNYKVVASWIDEWLDMHRDETFDLDLICRQLQVASREVRKWVATKLSDEVKKGKLDKSNKTYRYIDNTIVTIDWVNRGVGEEGTLPIQWPYGIEDESRFGFDGNAIVSQGDIIVVAGVSNTGKTTFCHNFLWLNMDLFPCTLMGNEYSGTKFGRRVSKMTWREPVREDGTPKFELIERFDNWKDIIRPDNINIIDWITAGENFYLIGKIIEGIRSKLKSGIALIALQKSGQKELGEGGDFSLRLASLYLTMDFNRMTVKKCKEFNGHDPNNEMYGFTIVNNGTQFHDIRRVKKCPKCYGKCVQTGWKCPTCLGKGFVDYTDNGI